MQRRWLPGNEAFGLPLGERWCRLHACQAMDDFEVVLFEAVLEHVDAWLDRDCMHRLHVLMIEVAPLLFVFEQAVTMALECCDDAFAVEAARASPRLPIDKRCCRPRRRSGTGGRRGVRQEKLS